jgi:hypothetical protein
MDCDGDGRGRDVIDRRLIHAARDVVRLMDKPVLRAINPELASAQESAAAWRAATRLAKALLRYDQETARQRVAEMESRR